MELNLSVLDQYDFRTCNIDFQIHTSEDFDKLLEYCTDKILDINNTPEYEFSNIHWFSIYKHELCFISRESDVGYDNSLVINLYKPGPLIKKPNLKKVWI